MKNSLAYSVFKFFHQQISIIFGVLFALKIAKVTDISWGFVASVVFYPLCFWMAVGFVSYFFSPKKRAQE